MTKNRDTMLMCYGAHPELLALELEILFEPCTDPAYAVLHNAALEKVLTLCARRTEEKDEAGITKSETMDFWCKRQLSARLARAVLMYARMQ